MRNFLFICILGVSSLSMTAQDNTMSASNPNTQQITDTSTEKNYDKKNLSDYYSTISGRTKKFSSEWNLYAFKTGVGIGFTRRYEFNPYICWNIVNFSFLSGKFEKFSFHTSSKEIEDCGWEGPANMGVLNLRFVGVRCHTPSFRRFRAYTDINIGYTYEYYRLHCQERLTGGAMNRWYETVENHWFGMDLSVGIQVHKNIALGYNCLFLAKKHEADITHMAKVSFLF